MAEHHTVVDFQGDYITVGQILKKLDIVSSGGEVKAFLDDHPIQVNGELENRRGRKLYTGDSIRIGRKSFTLRGHTDVSQ